MSTITSVTVVIAYAALIAWEMPALAEAPTARGRIDILIQAAYRIMVLEFKANAAAVEALRQVWDGDMRILPHAGLARARVRLAFR